MPIGPPRIAAVLVLATALALAISPPTISHAANSVGFTPLMDLGQQTYLGFQGGLYESGSNVVPVDHSSAGAAKAAQMQPLDGNGTPSAAGRIVLLSVGMSNTTQEFCSASSAPPCDSFTLMGQAASDSGVNHTSLVIVNGAAGGQSASTWESPNASNYDRVRNTPLAAAGVTERQVQAVWLKVANPNPSVSLPSSGADAYALETSMGNIARALKARYPNIRLLFVSSRIYAGYATTTLNPEPYAYESGFAVKWLIQAQIDQMRNGGTVVDARASDLNYSTVAPWIAWGPYLWADGLTPRSDGLIWQVTDFVSDGTHPSAPNGRQKVATMLLDFLKTSSISRCWFQTDMDGDGRSDACDNCPNWPNPAQNLPAWSIPAGDSDCDGFPNTVMAGGKAPESFIGTDPLRHCAATPTPNDEPPPDAWPMDFNDDQLVGLADVAIYSNVFGSQSPGPPYAARFDLNGDGRITLPDVAQFSSFFGKRCSP